MGLMVEMGRLAKKDDFFLSQNTAKLYQIQQFFKMQRLFQGIIESSNQTVFDILCYNVSVTYKSLSKKCL